MAGYIVRLNAKLIVNNRDPKAMAFAAEQLDGLKRTLANQGFSDVEVEPRYHDRLAADPE